MTTTRTTRTEVAHWIPKYIQGCDNPDFKIYAGGLAQRPDDRFLWLMEHLVRLSRMDRGRVLDIGCGFGWQAVALSLLGRSHIVANDIRPAMTSVVAERVDALLTEGAPISIETLTADICDSDLDSASFDAIICNQAIEHVRDLDAMFRVCFDALKPGARIVLTNDNNALNRKSLAAIRRMWERRDTDWTYIEQLKKERPIENRDIRPYAEMREEIVRRSNPGLADDEVAKVVEATAGLIESPIEGISISHAPGNALPTREPLSWCRNPITGEYCEKQLDPYQVAAQMAVHGFSAVVRHGFRKRPFRWLNGTRVGPLNRWLFQLRPFFIIVGRKPA